MALEDVLVVLQLLDDGRQCRVDLHGCRLTVSRIADRYIVLLSDQNQIAESVKNYLATRYDEAIKEHKESIYIAEAIRQYRINVIYYELDPDLHTDLENTMEKQNMLRNNTNK